MICDLHLYNAYASKKIGQQFQHFSFARPMLQLCATQISVDFFFCFSCTCINILYRKCTSGSKKKWFLDVGEIRRKFSPRYASFFKKNYITPFPVLPPLLRSWLGHCCYLKSWEDLLQKIKKLRLQLLKLFFIQVFTAYSLQVARHCRLHGLLDGLQCNLCRI